MNRRKRGMEWWQIRDMSYVDVKVMKSKSISEGLVRCKVTKSRTFNPIYDHIKVHQIKKIDQCPVCQPPPATPKKLRSTHFYTEPNSPSRRHMLTRTNMTASPRQPNPMFRTHHTSVNFRTEARSQTTLFINKQKSSHKKSLKEIVKCREELSLQRKQRVKGLDYALDERGSLAQEERKKTFDQLKGHSETASARLCKRADKLEKQVRFPFNQVQVDSIMAQSQFQKIAIDRKLNNFITSIYSYKSKDVVREKAALISKLVKKDINRIIQ